MRRIFYCRETYKVNSLLSVYVHEYGYIFFAALLERKINTKFMLASMKTLNNSTKISESRIIFSESQASEQFLDPEAAFCMPQQAVWGKGFLERCLELAIDFKGKQKLYFYILASSKKMLKSSATK